MKTYLFAIVLLALCFTPKMQAASVQVPAMWVFADYSMSLSTFDADDDLNEAIIIQRIKCLLRTSEHLVIFNYRSADIPSGIRISVQVVADLINVLPEAQNRVGAAMVTAYQAALAQARKDGNLDCYANAPLLGLNTMPMTSWVSDRTFYIASSDDNDFSTCDDSMDYSDIVRTVFTNTLDETDFNYFKNVTTSSSSSTSSSTTTSSSSSSSTSANIVTTSVVALFGLILAVLLN